MTTINEDSYLMHYGILRKSGRYPWGSGGDPVTRSRDFLSTIDELKKQGLSDVEIAKGMALYTEDGKPWSTTDYRAARSIANNAKKQADIRMAENLKAKGYSNVKIGERMATINNGVPLNESTVRSLLAPGMKDRADNLQSIASFLKDQVAQKEYVDIGRGTENHLGISKEKLKTAVAMLKEEGYKVGYGKVRQLGTGLETSLIVLAKPGTTNKEIYHNLNNVKTITDFSIDGGDTFFGIQPPLSISSKRIAIRYAEDGGDKADGIIYIRPGVKDVSIGTNRYAQVRVAVDGTHYLKGMALHKDDLPPGVDIMFNTNKSDTGNKLDAMKPLKTDNEANPFGSNIKRQLIELNKHGKEVVTSSMNMVYEEGDWEKWSRNLSSQTLSKQSPKLAKEQLNMTFEKKKAEFENIMQLTNPAVRRKLLESFAEDADSSAVHLKAAALPRASWHVILPINTLKETEVYAPNFRQGEKVALIRYPHAGTFEIPELTVNNRHPEAKAILGPNTQNQTQGAKDVIGINAKVAARLSGADFDGDAVLVIPNNSGSIKTSAPLRGLQDFEPKASYPPYDGMKTMDGGIFNAKTKSVEYTKPPSGRIKGIEMGKVSNLITDMTLKKASTEELARAVRHSMVVIDAEKHNLDWKASSRDNGIPALMKKYQNNAQGGASTLISQRKSPVRIPMRRAARVAEGGPINSVTGKRNFVPTGETFLNPKTGKLEIRTFKSQKLKETDDAHDLSSDTTIEKVYADHSNRLKDLANQARREYVATKPVKMSNSAKSVYHEEVRSLSAKLNEAKMNAPLERQAQIIANAQVKLKTQANPNLDAATKKKIEAQALDTARARVQAKKQRVNITDREWEAIQAGAISNHRLEEILNNADLDRVKALATPRQVSIMSSAKLARAKTMARTGYTQAEIADALGVSLTTLKTHLGGE